MSFRVESQRLHQLQFLNNQAPVASGLWNQTQLLQIIATQSQDERQSILDSVTILTSLQQDFYLLGRVWGRIRSRTVLKEEEELIAIIPRISKSQYPFIAVLTGLRI